MIKYLFFQINCSLGTNTTQYLYIHIARDKFKHISNWAMLYFIICTKDHVLFEIVEIVNFKPLRKY